MEKYQGNRMQLKKAAGRMTRRHAGLLASLMHLEDGTAEQVLREVDAYACGPYTVYAASERQGVISGGIQTVLPRVHLFVIYQDEVIAYSVTAATSMMQHVVIPALEPLQLLIPQDVFDLRWTIQVLNPCRSLFEMAEPEDRDKFERLMLRRMDALRQTGQDRTVLYVESACVREDCRRNGVLRLMLDTLRTIWQEPLIWMSLEPSTGSELSLGTTYRPAYRTSELGQISLNASIAEHLGFTVDRHTVRRRAETLREDGSTALDFVPVRRTAYRLPEDFSRLLAGDRALTDLLDAAEARSAHAEDALEDALGRSVS